MAAKYGIPYFSNYVNSDMEPSDVRSMCPLTGDTLVMVRNSQKKISILTISEIYNNHIQKNTEYEVWTNEGWCYGKPVQMPMTKVYNITMSNGCRVKMGEHHLQPIIGCKNSQGIPAITYMTVEANELSIGDWIPFNAEPIDTNLGDYRLGLAIGAYLGDGSYDDNAIVYSLNNTTKLHLVDELTTYWNSLGYSTSISTNDKIIFLRVNNGAATIISRYVYGENALSKEMTNLVFNSSIDFKKGLIDGYRYTDGAVEKNRLYTSSENLRNDLQMVLSSLGEKALINYEDTRDGRYGTNPNYRIDYPRRERYGNFYNNAEGYNAYQIVEKYEIDCNDSYLYCFEVSNDDHVFMLANGMMTHNCRLRLDLRELRKKSGGFFGSGESTGSVGVVSINMPKLGYLSENVEDFYQRLDHIMDVSAKSLKIKRNTIEKLMEDGLYPYTKRYLGTFNNHFSTIGLVGMNEMCLNAKWIGMDLRHEEAQKFTEEVLNHMRNRLSDYQEQYGDLYNLEATPAESTSYRFAKHDLEKYPDIINAACYNKNGDSRPYYTNSSHLPVGTTDDVFQALDVQDNLQVLYTSGTVFHTFLGEKLPNWKAAATLVRKIAENYKLPYYTLSPTYSICPDHGYIVGEHYECPTCGKKTEVYSRITGYYRAVQNWNDGKAQEFKDRKEYRIQDGIADEESDKKLTLKDECGIISSCTITKGSPDDWTTPVPNTDQLEPITTSLRIVTTPTCTNCKIVKSLMDKKGIEYETIDVTKNTIIANEYDIHSAPALIVTYEKGGLIVKHTVLQSMEAITQFIHQHC